MPTSQQAASERGALEIRWSTLDGSEERLADLPTQEQQHALAISNRRRRNQFITGRSLARQLIAEATGQAAREIPITVSDGGRPELDLPPSAATATITFSVAHSYDHCVAALGLDRQVGVDVELIEPRRRLGRLADAIFAPDELDLWQNTPKDDRLNVFFKLWTRKEALLKAEGSGLGRARARSASTLPLDKSGIWTWPPITAPNGYCAAVCWRAITSDAKEKPARPS